jgi:Arc/MetJ-type ribon-helix-helix transcriptional regulator
MKSLTIRLPDELVARIEAEALDRKMSISDVVREHLNRVRSSNPRRALFDAIIDLVSSAERLPYADRLPDGEPLPHADWLPDTDRLPDARLIEDHDVADPVKATLANIREAMSRVMQDSRDAQQKLDADPPWEWQRNSGVQKTAMSQLVPVCPAILSMIGWHAKESPKDIVRRKREDVEKVGRTVWVYQSWKAPVREIQHFGSVYPNPIVYFLKGSASPAGTAREAQQMSNDGFHWDALPKGIGKVTGKLRGGGLFIGELSAVSDY